MDTRTLGRVLEILRGELPRWKVPAVGAIADGAVDRPYATLVSTVLSLRTKDKVTEGASRRLLERAPTPRTLANLDPGEIERLIYPVGFYRTKAANLVQIGLHLEREHSGRIPGPWKSCWRCRASAEKRPTWCSPWGSATTASAWTPMCTVSATLWGYVATRTPDETEFALRRKLPRRHWITLNDILVTFGQNICVPVSPWCSRCPVSRYCPRIGLKRSR